MARPALLQRFGITIDSYPHAFRRDLVEIDRVKQLANARKEGRDRLRDIRVIEIVSPHAMSVLVPTACTVTDEGVVSVCLYLVRVATVSLISHSLCRFHTRSMAGSFALARIISHPC